MLPQFLLQKFTYFLILAQNSNQDISISTVALMLSYVFAFPIISGIIMFFITRGILLNIPKTRNSKHVRLLYWSIAIGGATLILVFAVFQVRTTV